MTPDRLVTEGGYGRSPESVRRFSVFKWIIAAILLALLFVVGVGQRGGGGTGEGAAPGESGRASVGGPGDGAPAGGGPTSAAKGSAALAITVDPVGRLRVQGSVADEATRDQWMNAIRIGAQGTAVTDELRIGAGDGAGVWSGRLSSLVALLKERRLTALSIEGDRVQIRGAAANAGELAETEKLMAAQLPAGFRLDNQIRLGASIASAASGATGAPSIGGDPAARSPAAGVPSAGPRVDATAGPQGTRSPEAGQATAGSPAAGSPAGGTQAAAAPSATASAPVTKPRPANCPRSLSSLAGPVYFNTDASGITGTDRARLQRLGQCLSPQARVRVVGHADPRHTDAYNKELSERRARNVAAEIAVGGVPSARITIVGAGRQQAARGTTPAALQRSRRVDIQIR